MMNLYGIRKNGRAPIVLVISLSLLTLAIMVYSFTICNRTTKRFVPLLDASNNIRLEAAVAYLWLNEIMSGNDSINIEAVWNRFDESIWYANAMLNGDENNRINVLRLCNPDLRREVEELVAKISDLKVIAEKRWMDQQASDVRLYFDKSFAVVFDDFLNQVDEMHLSLYGIVKVDKKKSDYIHTVLIVLCLFLGVATSLIVGVYFKRRKAEYKELEISKDQVELALYGADLGRWDWDMDTDKLYFNDRLAEMLGYKPDEIASHFGEWEKLIHPDDLLNTEKALSEYLEGRVNCYEIEHRMKHKSGRWIWVLDKGRIFERNEEGKPIRLCGTRFDINVRMHADQEKSRLLAAIDQVEECIVITDSDAIIEYVNPSFEKITGYTCEEAVGLNPRILKSGRQDDAFYDDMWKTLTNGDTWRGKFVNKKKDETLYIEDAVISPVYNGAGKLVNYVAVKRDVTKQERAMAVLQQAEKMEYVNSLVNGVVHDFSNLFMGILGYVDLCKNQIDPEHKVCKWLDNIAYDAQRSKVIIQQLLSLSNKQILKARAVDLNTLIKSELEMLRYLAGKDIDLVLKSSSNQWQIKIDPSQIDRIMVSLCNNACDAIDGVGHIVVEISDIVIDEKYCTTHAEASLGEYVVLSISDDGSGMDEQTLDRIFEPLFSTKSADIGTGVGLSAVRDIIKKSGGFIRVESELEKGTTFYIYLPRSISIVEESGKDESSSEVSVGGGETILVVEDDISIRSLTQLFLQNFGYSVMVAESSEVALGLVDECNGNIQLLLTDVFMPGMSGQDLAHQLRSKFPALKVLFMSGYKDFVSYDEVDGEPIEFLAKPFGQHVLGIKVRSILDAPAKINVGE